MEAAAGRELIRHRLAEGLAAMLARQEPLVASIGWDDATQICEIRAALLGI